MCIKEMIQAISTFIHLGDGCYCTLAVAEINLDEGRFTAIIRNGADEVYATHVYVVDQFGAQFIGSTTQEPNVSYELPFKVTTITSFNKFNEFTLNMYGCTYENLCDGELSWHEILSNFYEVSISVNGTVTSVGNQDPPDKVINIAEILTANSKWN